MDTPKSAFEALMKHPVAPAVGGFLIIASLLTDEPAPPEMPDDLPEATQKQWQMIYAQNLERHRRRMDTFQVIGQVLLGYASTDAVLKALPGAEKK